MWCENCQADVEIDEGMKFCPSCGHEIVWEKIFCWNCGKALWKGMKKCSGCGVQLEEEKIAERDEVEVKEENKEVFDEKNVEDSKKEILEEEADEDCFPKEEIYISEKNSGYNFRRAREKYRANGEKVTPEMYEASILDSVIYGVMIGLVFLIVIMNGFNIRESIADMLRYVLWIVPVIFGVCWYEGKFYGYSLIDKEEEGKKAIYTILNMTEEEVELRESRRVRDIICNTVRLAMLIPIFWGIDGNASWIELIEHVLASSVMVFVLTLPFAYIRHRATKRLRMFLMLRNAVKSGQKENSQ